MLPFLTALAPFAPIIGGAIGAVGQLFAPKPKPQKQTVTNSIDLKKLRSDAGEAGFNPLTIIRGGGLAGYGTSVQTMSAAPDLRFSNALSTFGSGVAQWDPFGVLERQASIKLAEAQIAHWGKQGAPDNMSFRTPSASGVMIGGQRVNFDESWSSADDITSRYGEPAEWLYSPFVMGADYIKHVRDNWRQPFHDGVNAIVRDATGAVHTVLNPPPARWR